MANEVLPVVKDTPVLAGVNGTDPFRVMGTFLDDVKRAGFAGVQNFPTVGLIDGTFRANLEETGMGFEHEIEMIRAAHERDLLTAPYEPHGTPRPRAANAAAPLLGPHVAHPPYGTVGASTALTLDDSVQRVQEMRDRSEEHT